jgi:two-component system, cell cycle response regulator
MRILIAEDDWTSRTILSATLKKAGHEPVETTDGLHAWEELQKTNAPRLVILDWMMPGIDGLEVLRRIRAIPTEQPPYILMVTARTKKAEIIAGLEAGADDYLAKPFDAGELIARIEVGRRMVALQEELVKSREAVAFQAAHDSLTGLPNRRAILGILQKELARAGRHIDLLSVGMCDIDHFKTVNDTYGHQTGDDVLCELAHVMTGCCRQYDSIGRMGGEEFLFIVPIKAGKDPVSFYKRLCEKVAEARIKTRSGMLSVTTSIGVATATGAGTVDDLLSRADVAMYRAKVEGRNRVVFAPSPLNPLEAT